MSIKYGTDVSVPYLSHDMLFRAVIHNTDTHLASFCYGKHGDAGLVKFWTEHVFRIEPQVVFVFLFHKITPEYSLPRAGKKPDFVRLFYMTIYSTFSA